MRGEQLFRLLLRAYPRAFRERYHDDLLAFYREERAHPRYGGGPLRPLRFWSATLRDLVRTAATEHRPVLRRPRMPAGESPLKPGPSQAGIRMEQVLAHVEALPGVRSAVLVAGGVPLTGSWNSAPVRVGDAEWKGADEVVLKQVTADYFQTIGAQMLSGRLALGFLIAVWLERLVMAFVYRGVHRDPLVYAGAALLLVVLGLLAAYVPARRAARVDPLMALRAE